MDANSTSKRWLTGVRPKELGDVYRAAMAAGCTCHVTKGTHVKVSFPKGGSLTGPLTGGGRADKMMRSRLRRAGIEL
jgi:hypothetical protein